MTSETKAAYPMPHFSEVLKIVRGALTDDKRLVLAYAELLADKLSQEGNAWQAGILRRYMAGDFGTFVKPAQRTDSEGQP